MASLLIGSIAAAADKIKESRAKRRASRETAKRASISSIRSNRSLGSVTHTEMQARMLHKYNTGRFNTHPLYRPPMGDAIDDEDVDDDAVDDELPRYSADVSAPGYREVAGAAEEGGGGEQGRSEAWDRLENLALAEARIRSFGGSPGQGCGWGWA